MSMYGEYDYPDEWQNEPPGYYPGSEDTEDYNYDPEPDEDPADIPRVHTFTIVDDDLVDRLEEDDPVETDDPYDTRGWR